MPYLAESGTVGFVAAAAVTALGAAGELVSPGLVFNLVAPQGLVAAMIVTGALSLLSEKPRRTWRTALTFGAVALTVTVCVTLVTWRYFEALPGDRVIVTVAAGISALLVFIAAARLTKEVEDR